MTFTDQQPTTAEIPLLQTAFPTYCKSQDQPVPVSKLSSNTYSKLFVKAILSLSGSMLLYKTALMYIPFNLLTSSCSTAEPLKTGMVHGATHPKKSAFASPQPLSASPECYKGYVETLSLL